MSTKRRRPSATQERERGQPRVKRVKFTLESVSLPSITTKGAVFVTGTGDVGQLGLGPDILEKSRPTFLKMEHEVVDICAGGMHTVCLTKDGQVLSFGCNDEGALGRVLEEDGEYEPGFVDLPGKVIQISAGDSHTCALLDDGRVFTWGTFRDSHGNMGLTVNGNEKLPIQILSDQYIMKIASGADHIVFLTRYGEVYTCGCAEQGQLGRTTSRGSGRMARNGVGHAQVAKLVSPALITLKPSLKLHFDNIWAGTYSTFAKVAGSKDIYVFGLNNYYQIGLKSTTPQYAPAKSPEFSKYKWKTIACAQHHTIALTTDGKAFVIGRKEYGRLGLGDVAEDAQELTQVLADKNIVAVGCGAAQSFAVTDTGDLYGWGMGTGGQLGTGSEEDCLVPTLIKSKQIKERKIIRVAGGGQHTVMLALDTEIKEEAASNKKVKKEDEPRATKIKAEDEPNATATKEEDVPASDTNGDMETS